MKSFAVALLAAHIAAGTVAVVVGLAALVAPKPVGRQARAHRRAGRVFLYSMAVVVGTATVLTLLSLNAYFAGLTAASTVAVFSGYRVLGRKRPDLDASHRARASRRRSGETSVGSKQGRGPVE